MSRYVSCIVMHCHAICRYVMQRVHVCIVCLWCCRQLSHPGQHWLLHAFPGAAVFKISACWEMDCSIPSSSLRNGICQYPFCISVRFLRKLIPSELSMDRLKWEREPWETCHSGCSIDLCYDMIGGLVRESCHELLDETASLWLDIQIASNSHLQNIFQAIALWHFKCLSVSQHHQHLNSSIFFRTSKNPSLQIDPVPVPISISVLVFTATTQPKLA